MLLGRFIYYFCTNLWKCLSLFDGFICSDGREHTYSRNTAAAPDTPKVSSDFIMSDLCVCVCACAECG